MMRVSLSLLAHSHPTSCCSAAEIMAVLFFHTMRYKPQDPRNPHNDRFVLSKVGAQRATLHLGQVSHGLWNGEKVLAASDLRGDLPLVSPAPTHPFYPHSLTAGPAQPLASYSGLTQLIYLSQVET